MIIMMVKIWGNASNTTELDGHKHVVKQQGLIDFKEYC